MDGFEFNKIFGGWLNFLAKLIFFNDYFLYILATLLIFAPVVTARFRFWRYLAEAQSLIATAETADNTAAAPLD